MSSCIILVLHASSCACCLVPALAALHPLHPQSVPVLRDVCVHHSERHHRYWLYLGSFCLHVEFWFCCDSQLELSAGRRSSHANYCVCIPSLVLGESSGPRSLVSIRSSHHDFVLSRRYSHEQSVLPPPRLAYASSCTLSSVGTGFLSPNSAISRFAAVPRAFSIDVLPS